MTKKITPELLRTAKTRISHCYSSEVIDEIREMLQIREEGDYWCDAQNILTAIADSIEEHYIELPVDNRGEPIHIGDSIYCALDDYAEPHKVWGVELGASPFVDASVGVLLNGEDIPRWVAANNTFHDKPDSWERIIRDAIEHGFSDRSECSELADETAVQLIARCRKLAGETDE